MTSRAPKSISQFYEIILVLGQMTISVAKFLWIQIMEGLTMISLILRLSKRLHQDFHDSTLSQLSLKKVYFHHFSAIFLKVPDVSPLSDQLADGISSIGLCAAHILTKDIEIILANKYAAILLIYLADKQLCWDTQKKGRQLKKNGVNLTFLRYIRCWDLNCTLSCLT